jgi:hypothetical protein
VSTPESRATRTAFPRWAGLGAIAYVVLFIGGSVLMFGGEPDTDSPPAKIISYYRDSGHRDKIGIGWAIVILGVFFFLWFLGALRQYLRRIDEDGFLTNVATVGGTIYAALTLTSVALNSAIKTMSDDTFHHQVYPPLIHAADDAGWVIHSSGGIGAGALIIAASLAAMRAARIPSWAGWVGMVFGILALASIFGFTQLAIALWLIAAGVLLFRATPVPAGPVGGGAAPSRIR